MIWNMSFYIILLLCDIMSYAKYTYTLHAYRLGVYIVYALQTNGCHAKFLWRDVMASVPERQGDNEDQLEIIRWTKKEFPKMQVIGGNVATYL